MQGLRGGSPHAKQDAVSIAGAGVVRIIVLVIIGENGAQLARKKEKIIQNAGGLDARDVLQRAIAGDVGYSDLTFQRSRKERGAGIVRQVQNGIARELRKAPLLVGSKA